MDEYLLQWFSFFKIVYVAIFALLYGLGGIRHKEIRRWAGSFFLTVGIVVFSLWLKTYNMWLLGYWPLLASALSIGYGADDLKTKLIKRSRYGAACGFASIPIAIVTGQWVMFALHIFLCVFISTLWGTLNMKDARHEETAIGFFIGFLPLYMV